MSRNNSSSPAPTPAGAKAKAGKPVGTPPRKRKRWALRIVAILVVALVALVVAAPMILSLDVCRSIVIDRLNEALPCRVATDDWSLSWLGSQEIRRLAVQTSDGQPVARADRVVLDQGLLALLGDRSHIGAVRVEEGNLWIDGLRTVLEKAAAAPKPPHEPKPPSQEPPTLPAEITASALTLHSRTALLQLKDVTLAGEQAGTDRRHIKANWSIVRDNEHGSGTIEADIDGLRTDWRGWDALGVRAHLVCGSGFPLAVAWALAADAGTGLDGAGTLSTGDFTITRTRTGGIAVEALCDATQASVTGKLLNGDRPVLDSLHLEAKTAYAAGKLEVDRFVFKSPVATAEARGTFAEPIGAELPAVNGTATASANLALLAKMLPRTLKVQEGMAVSSGTLDATVKLASNETTAAVTVTADVKNLSGRRNGKELALSPIHLAANVERDRRATAAPGAAPDFMSMLQSLRVNDVALSGPFGTVEARGQMEAFSLDAKLDLTQTTEEVGRFVDLEGRSAQGTAVIHAETKGDFGAGVRMAVKADLAQLSLNLGQGRAWQEEKASVVAAGKLSFDAQRRFTGCSGATLAVASSTASLAAAGDYAQASPWTFKGTVKADGDVARTASLADVVLALVRYGEPTKTDAAAAAQDSGPMIRSLVQRVASVRDPDTARRWGLSAQGEGAAGKTVSGDVAFQICGFSLPAAPSDPRSPAVQLSEAHVTAHASYDDGGSRALSLKATVGARQPQIALAGGTAWADEDVSLNVAGTLTLAAGGGPAAMTVDQFVLTSTTARIEAGGEYAQAKNAPWTFRGTVKGSGTTAASASLAYLLMQAAQPAPAGATDAAPPWWDSLREVSASTPAEGAWRISAQGDRAAGKALSLQFSGEITNLTGRVGPKRATPLRIVKAAVTGAASQDEKGLWHLAITRADLASPEAALVATADLQVPADFDLAAITGKAAANANIDVDILSATLHSLDALPDAPRISGKTLVELTLATDAAEPRRVRAKVSAKATDVEVAWPDKRKISQPHVALDAEATILREAAGALGTIAVSRWTLDTPAGSLKGTGTIKPAAAWAIDGTAEGEGDVAALVELVASATDGKPGAIRGHWKLASKFSQAATGQSIELDASASGLVIPTGDPAAPQELHLADAHLDTAVAIAADGAIRIDHANVSGPGLTAKAAGTLKLPAEPLRPILADGSVALHSDLAQLAAVLQPLGLLDEKSTVSGQADFEGKVASTADGLSAGGTLTLTKLEAVLPASEIKLDEPRAVVPFSVSYRASEGQWTAAVNGLDSAMAKGTATASWTAKAPATPQLDAQCDLHVNGERLTDLLKKQLPKDMTLAGDWGITGARVRGPVPPTGPWNQRIAGLAGSGTLLVGNFTFAKLAVTGGTLPWQMGDGVCLINPDPSKPAHLIVAEGKVTPAGRIDLRPVVPHLVIAQPLHIMDDLHLSDPGVAAYLKFGSQALTASINPQGRLFAEIDSLDVPLSGDEYKKATGTARYWIDNFQTQLTGELAAVLSLFHSPTKTPVQRLGPVTIVLKDAVFNIQQHSLIFSDDTTLKFKGRIGMDGAMDAEVDIPMTAPMLTRFGASKSFEPYLVGKAISVPMTGTIEKPHVDAKVVVKRISEMGAEGMKHLAAEEIGNFLKGSLKPKK
jgi:hypothetical protein